MRLTLLEPRFLKILDERAAEEVDSIAGADGIIFLCPRCFETNGNSGVGTHSIICWRPHIPQTRNPIPGRWEFGGQGYGDLTLVAGSSSVKLEGGCNAHFLIQRGEVTFV